jgi:hypothetical protein
LKGLPCRTRRLAYVFHFYYRISNLHAVLLQDSDVLDMSVPESVLSLSESGISAMRRQVCHDHMIHCTRLIIYIQRRARTAALLARRLSHTPPIDQVGESGRVPMTLEERLRTAQELIDQELEELADLRTEMNKFNDQLLQHVLILRNVRRNLLHW